MFDYDRIQSEQMFFLGRVVYSMKKLAKLFCDVEWLEQMEHWVSCSMVLCISALAVLSGMVAVLQYGLI